jgi:hypothetical protein
MGEKKGHARTISVAHILTILFTSLAAYSTSAEIGFGANLAVQVLLVPQVFLARVIPAILKAIIMTSHLLMSTFFSVFPNTSQQAKRALGGNAPYRISA